jgi:hypothetical protein
MTAQAQAQLPMEKKPRTYRMSAVAAGMSRYSNPGQEGGEGSKSCLKAFKSVSTLVLLVLAVLCTSAVLDALSLLFLGELPDDSKRANQETNSLLKQGIGTFKAAGWLGVSGRSQRHWDSEARLKDSRARRTYYRSRRR